MHYVDSQEFYQLVKPIHDREKLWALGLDPKSCTGVFDRSDIRDLASFCDANPAYHVVSWLRSRRTVNYLEPTGFRFYLAQGNRDPRLAYLLLDTQTYWVPLTAKMRRQAFFTVVPGGESRDNPKLFANALDHLWPSTFFHHR